MNQMRKRELQFGERAGQSILGLDDEISLVRRIGRFFATLVLGALIETLLVAASLMTVPPWRVLPLTFCELFSVFWVCSLVYMWWRPPWLRRLYLAVERKILIIVIAFVVINPFLIVAFVR